MRYVMSIGLLPLATAQIACIAAITTTIPYLAALAPRSGSCPTDAANNISYNLLEGGTNVCCTRAAQLQSVLGAVACCPCGAQCTGAFPSILDWTIGSAGLVTSSKQNDATMAVSAPRTSISVTGTTAAPSVTATVSTSSRAAVSGGSTVTAATSTTSQSSGSILATGQGKAVAVLLALLAWL